MHVEPSRVKHSNSVFWVKTDTFLSKFYIHCLWQDTAISLLICYSKLNKCENSKLWFESLHFLNASNAHKCYENNDMCALEVSEICFAKSVNSVF